MAVWGDRLEMGRLEKIRACPRVAVRLTLGGTHLICAPLNASEEGGQATLVEGAAARLINRGYGWYFPGRVQRRGLHIFALNHLADVLPTPFLREVLP